jgi:hypothetical protein
MAVSSGPIVSNNLATVCLFLTSGTFTPQFSGTVEVLVVAGGGGGGMDMGGGGGGGGVITNSNFAVTAGTAVTVTVGAGGFGAPAAGGGLRTDGAGPQPGGHQYTIPATSGGNSVFGSLTAIGGGFGGSSYRGYTPGIAGGAGGSGGGSSGYNDNAGTFNGGAGTAGQGFRGGNSTAAYYSGGGGGAGGQGVDSTSQPNGGPGLYSAIIETPYYWAGGGGGGGYSISGGNGGIGGGGGGAVGSTTGGVGFRNGSPGGGGVTGGNPQTPGGNAGANTGSGGGGGSHYNANNRGGEGGSGIVAVRFLTSQGTAIVTNGMIFNNNNDVIMSYDTTNSQKSLRGAPTTNYVATQAWGGDYGGNVFTQSIPDPALMYRNLQTSLLRNTTSSFNCYINGGNLNQSFASTNWTFLCYIRRGDRLPIPALLTYLYTSSADSDLGTVTALEDGWYRIFRKKTGTSAAASLAGFTGLLQNVDYYISGASLTPTPYPVDRLPANSTRSNTQSIIDLTGRNILTASNLEYADNDTVGFSRALSSSILTNLPISATPALSNFTYEILLNVTSLPPASNNGVILGAVYYSGAAIYWRTSGTNFNIKGFIRGADAYRSTAEFTLALNTNYHVVMTNNFSAGTLNLYINGVLFSSVATATQQYNPDLIPGLNIGINQPQVDGGGSETYSYFTGKVDSAKIYNRALSAIEVQQNFNTVRERLFGYQILTYISSANITLLNNGTDAVTVAKNADNNSWSGQAYSTRAFTAPCTIEFSKQAAVSDNGASYAMIGWNTDPTTDANYTSLDHASYPYRSDTYSVYNNGSQVHFSGAWDVNKKFYIVYGTDGFIRHYNGSTLLYSANYGTGNIVYVDCSLYNTDSTFGIFKDVKVSCRAWNGLGYA